MPQQSAKDFDAGINETPETLALTLDLETYLGQLTHWDISEEQKKEFIIAWWELLVSFGQIGFQIHPVQMSAKTGRKPMTKPEETQESARLCADNVLHSKPYYRTRIIDKSSSSNAGDSADTNNETRPK